ncbi:hypothetical protein L2U69_11785 [Zavarzinia compransoris]|uniref:hypothetical protein n=1 Tax=Zavarzinia marina TaxID=2911065 RepID=UPI001F1BCFF6|nr:hypothetical protein [Zavarzinia marina]MCF4166327.1 hypothetical protein [Zavarzinia marina]
MKHPIYGTRLTDEEAFNRRRWGLVGVLAVAALAMGVIGATLVGLSRDGWPLWPFAALLALVFVVWVTRRVLSTLDKIDRRTAEMLRITREFEDINNGHL